MDSSGCHLFARICFAYLVLTYLVSCFPDPGKWSYSVDQQNCHFFEAHKALYKNSNITITVSCSPNHVQEVGKDIKLKVGYTIRQSSCYKEYVEPELMGPDFLKKYFFCPASLFDDFGYDSVTFYKSEVITVSCDHLLNERLKVAPGHFVSTNVGMSNQSDCFFPDQLCPSSPRIAMYVREMGEMDSGFDTNVAKRSIRDLSSTQKGHVINAIHEANDPTISIQSEGVYRVILYISVINPKDRFNATVDIEMKGEYGYLSADEWPLLPFYGIMSVVYLFYAIIWMIASAMQWRDLLRIQFWIGGVIFLGMLEKAVFYAEYQSINSSGVSVKGALLTAELISCLKRTLARMLVIIVSLGFGIVKPRLGPMLHRVVCVGALFFSLSALEAILRIYRPKHNPADQTLMAGIPLAVLDSTICWWIFSSLVQTMRTLRLRRNLVKLYSYRTFTNTLITAVVASIVFMVWVIHYARFTRCISNWKQLWWDTAYWDALFSMVLLVIMILWRPTNNNQRYAFTPLLDASDDEDDLDDQVVLGEAFDRVKMRQQPATTNNASKAKDAILSKEAEEDLRWIEENIPSSLVDAALPALIDSDEEIMSTRFERNKME